MNIKPEDKTIKDILLSRRQFVIPRFQREYSWDKKNYQEFWEDIISGIEVNNEGKITNNQYFLGTMLFIGNYTDGKDSEIQVVDGQQRLTTITILFSALSDCFKRIKQETLSERIFEYIMTRDDDGNDVRVLKSKTHYPYFSYFIQDREKRIKEQPDSEEEKCIFETYNFFNSQLEETKLRESFKRKNGYEGVEKVEYVDLLKSIRDQVLNSVFVSISTTDKEQANKIFEILNAKGKRLAHIDLIKNKIFEKLNTTEPADYAEITWEKIKKNLNSGNENVGMATFYRHYWVSKYKKSSSNALYEDFNKVVKANAYGNFLEDMLKGSEAYMKIINPQREDYNNRKEYFWLVQSLKCLNNYFNIVQTRIILLALYDVKERNIVNSKLFKSTVLFLENFHFAYNAIAVKNSNRFDSIYSKSAIALRKAKNSTEARIIIENQLIKPLKKIFPKYEEFEKKFVELTFSKKDCSSNVKTKYILNKLHCLAESTELFDDSGSVEHILPESYGGDSLNIGNLILLESNINQQAGEKEYEEKKNYYINSKYKEVLDFCDKHDKWEMEDIMERAKTMSKIYYTCILDIGLEI